MDKNIEKRADMRLNAILDPQAGGVDIKKQKEVMEIIDYYETQGKTYKRIAEKLKERLEEINA